jgi:radical SAM superfamily enzyme YgiQ (UPF0313 family)
MKILLVRPAYKSIFSLFNPVITEPLALEYLATIISRQGHRYSICDQPASAFVLIKKLLKFKPDLVAITGYLTAEDEIKKIARRVKLFNPKILVMAGGVHVELNYRNLQTPYFDILSCSGGIQPFSKLLAHNFSTKSWPLTEGIRYRQGKTWKTNKKLKLNPEKLPLPNRSYFRKNIQKFRYLNYGPVALLKTAWGCPFKCNFCYCRMLNDQQYLPRKITDVIHELKTIEHDLIWIIDDTFLLKRKRVEKFIEQLHQNKIRKKFIVYSRADFIAENSDLLPALRQAGVIDIIVGLEATEDKTLDQYETGVKANQNNLCVKYLRENGINLTALFMIKPDATCRDFKKMGRWIKKMKINTYTLSIFLPLPGTEIYEKYREKLTTNKIRKWDFLHLVLPPENMNRFSFYFNFYKLYFRAFVKNINTYLPEYLSGRTQ